MPKQRWWKLLWTALPLGACIVAMIICYKLPTFISSVVFSGLRCPEGKVVPEDTERLTRGKFPPSASNMSGYQPSDDFTGDCKTYLRFEIAPDELYSFLASTRIKLPLESKTNIDVGFSLLQGEKPTLSDTSYLYGTSPVALDYIQTIFVDHSNPEHYVIYMHIRYKPF